jgi:hypothetical protein
MATFDRTSFAREVRDVLAERCPANETLHRLVAVLDAAAANEGATPEVSAVLPVIVRALVATGAALPDIDSAAMSNVRLTLARGEAYLDAPSESTYSAYEDAATRSYPFGQGDGCYQLPGAKDCDVGSGCRSGAGSIAQVALSVGEDRALELVRGALAPYLTAERKNA